MLKRILLITFCCCSSTTERFTFEVPGRCNWSLFRRDSYINKYCMKPDLDGSDITPLNRGWSMADCLSLVNCVGCLSNSGSWFEKLARANKLAESLQSHFKRLEAFVVEAFWVHVNVTSLNFIAQDYVVYVVLRLKLTIPVLELT